MHFWTFRNFKILTKKKFFLKPSSTSEKFLFHDFNIDARKPTSRYGANELEHREKSKMKPFWEISNYQDFHAEIKTK